jgi:tetratricopeptide (TPR) repeat protein
MLTAEKEKSHKNAYEKALTAFEQAMKAFHKGDYTKADAALTAFVEKYPEEKELLDRAHIYTAICKRHLSPEKITLKTFDDYYRHGVYQLNQGQFEEAVKLLNKAHEMQPKAGEVLYYLANTYCHMQDVEQCLEYLKQAVMLNASFAILAQNELDFDDLREDQRFALITKMA